MTVTAASLLVADQMWRNGPGPWHGPGSWWIAFPILWFLLLATVITLAVLGLRQRGRLSGQRAGERRLAERFAAGEIDEHEYHARLARLKAAKR